MCLVGCRASSPSTLPKPVASTAPATQLSNDPPQVVLLGDGHREWLGANGKLYPITGSTSVPVDKSEQAARAYCASHNIELGAIVFKCPTEDGTYMIFSNGGTHSQPLHVYNDGNVVIDR
jgi:hypothetical protein